MKTKEEEEEEEQEQEQEKLISFILIDIYLNFLLYTSKSASKNY